MITTSEIEKAAKWTKPREVQTKFGPRLFRKAQVTPEFSEMWKRDKEGIKALGASFSKTPEGAWELAWWQQIDAAEQQRRAEALEASKATSASVDFPHPEGVEYMPFQKAGIAYGMAHKNVLLADEPGLGKTLQAIGIINADPAVNSVIIICPKSIKLNWLRELEKWLVRKYSIAVINGEWVNADIVILNYEALTKYAAHIKAHGMYDVCIADEAHRIKNAKTITAKNVKAIKARRHIRITGTPIVNRPAELYNIICDLADFGSFFAFAKRYCNANHTGFGWDFSGASNLDELQNRLRSLVMVRRLKAEVLKELPRKIRQIIEIAPESAAQRSAVKREGAFELSSEERLASLRAAVELSKAESEEAYKAAVEHLRKASELDFTEISRLRHDTALSKVDAVADHVTDLLDDNAEQKVIVMAHHHDVINALREKLVKFCPVVLTGETKQEARQQAVDAFQSDPAARVFIGSITAAGVGITLTAANIVVFAELDWVPGNVTQAEDRAHRIGQTDTVLIQHLVLSGSIDARMAEVLVAKQRVIDDALDADHAERERPVFEPRQAAGTRKETVATIRQTAESITPKQIAAIRQGLAILAGMDDDHAAERNGQGFSKIDVAIGHALAELETLTPRQAALGLKLVTKYKRQLPEGLLNEINQNNQ